MRRYNEGMKTMDAINEMLAQSGKSANSVSVAMGKHRNYIASSIYKDVSPQSDNLARIAEICGFELVLKGPDGAEIKIDPAPITEHNDQS